MVVELLLRRIARFEGRNNSLSEKPKWQEEGYVDLPSHRVPLHFLRSV